jgi:cysteine-rich repeat protein
VLKGVEVCDDGNDIEDDGCSTHCTREFLVGLR